MPSKPADGEKQAKADEPAKSGEHAESDEQSDADMHAGEDEQADVHKQAETDENASVDDRAVVREQTVVEMPTDLDEQTESDEQSDADMHAGEDEQADVHKQAETDENARVDDHAVVREQTVVEMPTDLDEQTESDEQVGADKHAVVDEPAELNENARVDDHAVVHEQTNVEMPADGDEAAETETVRKPSPIPFCVSVVLVILAFVVLSVWPIASIARTNTSVTATYPLYLGGIFAVLWCYVVFEWFRSLRSDVDAVIQALVRKLAAVLLILFPLGAVQNLSQKVTVSEDRFESTSLLLGKIFGPKSFTFDKIRRIERIRDKEGNDVLRFFVDGDNRKHDINVNILVKAVFADLRDRSEEHAFTAVRF